MNPGDSVQDASRSGLDEASGFSTAVGQGNGTPTRSPRTQKPLQDIQDLIDKLAAVTQQLRHPASSLRGSSREPGADRTSRTGAGR